MYVQCVRCKGRGFCGRKVCAFVLKAKSMLSVSKKLTSTDYCSYGTAPFIGRHGYPKVSVGVLAPASFDGDPEFYDNPYEWSKKNLSIQNIIELRSSLINSKNFSSVYDINDKHISDVRDITLSTKPPEIEVKLEQKPRFRIKLDAYSSPLGPSARLKSLAISSNPKIPGAVEKSDDRPAEEALTYLYKKRKFNENYLAKALSVGSFGLNKKLVPTRWSITATDDILSRSIIQELKQYQEVEYSAFSGSFLGNYYLILMFPGPFSYELFETYMPDSSYNTSSKLVYETDYEDVNGRKDYADSTAGGYYATRLAVAEKLRSMKKQGSVLVIRVITPEYSVPLGVWVVRQAVRKTLQSRGLVFDSKELLLKYAKIILMKKFNIDSELLLKTSKLLKSRQSMLNKYF